MFLSYATGDGHAPGHTYVAQVLYQRANYDGPRMRAQTLLLVAKGAFPARFAATFFVAIWTSPYYSRNPRDIVKNPEIA